MAVSELFQWLSYICVNTKAKHVLVLCLCQTLFKCLLACLFICLCIPSLAWHKGYVIL